jgi:hypothetical protein
MIELNNVNEQIILSVLNLSKKCAQAISENNVSEFTKLSVEMLEHSTYHSKEYRQKIKSLIDDVCWEMTGQNVNLDVVASDFSSLIVKISRRELN